MLCRVLKALAGKLTLITRSIPDRGDVRMPRRDVRLMEDIDSVWSAVVELLEVAAVPAGWRIQRILGGVQIVRSSLHHRQVSVSRRLLLVHVRQSVYLVMTNDSVHIDKLRMRRVGWLRIMLDVNVRGIAIVVRVPR